MSIECVFHCDCRDCNTNVQTASAAPPLWLTVTDDGAPDDPMYFCSWDCVLKYAAEVPPVEVIPL
jgi:hypothetical protein